MVPFLLLARWVSSHQLEEKLFFVFRFQFVHELILVYFRDNPRLRIIFQLKLLAILGLQYELNYFAVTRPHGDEPPVFPRRSWQKLTDRHLDDIINHGAHFCITFDHMHITSFLPECLLASKPTGLQNSRVKVEWNGATSGVE